MIKDILKDAEIRRGERWIYSTDFNVSLPLSFASGCPRIDSELGDIKRISDSGGIVVILAHRARYQEILKDAKKADLSFTTRDRYRVQGI